MNDEAPARDPAAEAGVPAYTFRPSLRGASWQFRLLPDELEWRAGHRGGRAPYADIRRLRLSFRPVSMQTYRFMAEIWPRRGGRLRVVSSSWRSMVEQERLDAGYRAFVTELGRRLAGAQPMLTVETGLPALPYWTGLVAVAVVALGLVGLVGRALQVEAWNGGAFMATFVVLFLWQAGTFLRRNRPRRCRPDAIPPEVLPNEVVPNGSLPNGGLPYRGLPYRGLPDELPPRRSPGPPETPA